MHAATRGSCCLGTPAPSTGVALRKKLRWFVPSQENLALCLRPGFEKENRHKAKLLLPPRAAEGYLDLEHPLLFCDSQGCSQGLKCPACPRGPPHRWEEALGELRW